MPRIISCFQLDNHCTSEATQLRQQCSACIMMWYELLATSLWLLLLYLAFDTVSHSTMLTILEWYLGLWESAIGLDHCLSDGTHTFFIGVLSSSIPIHVAAFCKAPCFDQSFSSHTDDISIPHSTDIKIKLWIIIYSFCANITVQRVFCSENDTAKNVVTLAFYDSEWGQKCWWVRHPVLHSIFFTIFLHLICQENLLVFLFQSHLIF